jgi:uncharacterized protein YhaN
MRIRQLDLLRYGHFTDASIDLPARVPDFHFVLGENEAGKSTAMAGLEDLLFGIPPNSPRNFLHDYGAMRIGAILEHGTGTLNIRRRKGRNDTLLSELDLPLPAGEGALAPYLSGADRRFYTRMFSLDHARLRDGGKEILRAQDDVGQMLFSASAGVTGLREILKAMEAEADALWASRRAAHRGYFQAEERLKAAEASMREHVVTTGKWQLLKSAFETANEAYRVIEHEIETKSTEQLRLSRIRRVWRDVHARAEIEAAIQAIGTVVPFAEEASQRLEKAAKDDADAASRMATLSDQIAALEVELAALSYDQALLARADDIQQLHDRRIQIRAGKADLPKRRAELAAAEARFLRLAGELEWNGDVDRLIARIPARAKVAALRTLLNKHGGQIAVVENAKTAVREATDKLAELAEQIGGVGTPNDVSKLTSVIKAVRAMGDIGAQVVSCKRDEQLARAAIDRALSSLRPPITDPATLSAMSVSPPESVEAHREACRELEQRRKTCRERARAADQELARHRKAHDRIAVEEHVVTLDELERLRRRRDAGWSIIRRRHLDGTKIPEEEVLAFAPAAELPEAFERAIREADDAADRRFEKSKAAAQLVEIGREIADQKDLIETLAIEERGLTEERGALDLAWAGMWAGTPVVPQDPDVMIQWLRTRTEILDTMAKLSAAERQTAVWQEREADARRLLKAELDALGASPASASEQPLPVLIESAATVERTYADTAKTRRELEASLRRATADAGRKREAMEAAEAGWKGWTTQWAAALNALQLPPNSTPETADAELNAIDEMREAAGRINDLRHDRIEKIERDIKAFERNVAALIGAVAPQLAGKDPEDAVLESEELLAEAKRVRDEAVTKQRALRALRRRIEEYRESSQNAREVIERLQAAAGVETLDAVRDAIRRSDEMHRLRTKFDRLTDALAQNGDGLSVAALIDECGNTDLDAISAREQTVTQELAELRERQMEARETRSNARQEFEAIGGDDRAARDAADKQAALAEMKEIAGRYVRLRSAIVLLQWTIDQYRREKQAPLLRRAGEFFAILTGGSFQTLQLEYDDQDNVELAGVRRDGRYVGVAGMSDGTVDQLFLALRIAAMEDYLDHTAPMPFIADDLFINFDDTRAAAGFKVLSELAQKTQVLFFTHHQHLLEIANKAIGTQVQTVVLASQTASSDLRTPYTGREAA